MWSERGLSMWVGRGALDRTRVAYYGLFGWRAGLQKLSTDSRTPVQTCQGCIHFYITYDPAFPYGCRVMGFKGRRHPWLEVLEASGAPCQARQVKRD